MQLLQLDGEFLIAVVSSSSYIAVSITYNTSSVGFVGRPLLRSVSMDNASWTAKLSGDIEKFLSCAGIPCFILHLLWLCLESNPGTSIDSKSQTSSFLKDSLTGCFLPLISPVSSNLLNVAKAVLVAILKFLANSLKDGPIPRCCQITL